MTDVPNYAVTNNLGSSVGWGETNFRYADRSCDMEEFDADGRMKIMYMGSRQGRTNKFINENSIYLEKTNNRWEYIGVVLNCTQLTQYRILDPRVYELIIDTTYVINDIPPGTVLSKNKMTALGMLGFTAGGRGCGSPNNGAFAIREIA